MAHTAVNDQVTDAVTQTNVKVVAEAPAMAQGSLYQTDAHSLGLMFQNAIASQQQQNAVNMAAANQGVMQIYSNNSLATAAADQKTATNGSGDNTALVMALAELIKTLQP
ncbi:RebB family R body protein [Chromobacterium subtsugae]|uniref:RebB family R body protein n=1 Tax=Chromobacterium subtsugae TaxID=251747 RepID=UPI000641128F|nr:RebB family R body protein [Chromobacterium subtsugae]